jgi:hypothetical protein
MDEVTRQPLADEQANVIGTVGDGEPGWSLLFAAAIPEGPRLRSGWVHDARRSAEGLGVALTAAVAVRRAGLASGGRLGVAAVAGNAQGDATRALLSGRPSPGGVVVTSPTAGAIVLRRPGHVRLVLTIIGQTAWVGAQHRRPHVNAISQMRAALGALSVAGPRAGGAAGVEVAVRNILGGFTSEYILARPAQHADHCSALLDIRFATGTSEDAAARVRATLDSLAADPDLRYRLEPPESGGSHWPEPPGTLPITSLEPDHPFARRVAEARADVHGSPVGTPSSDGASPAAGWEIGALLAASGVPCVDHGPGAPERPEPASPEQMAMAARVLALAAARDLALAAASGGTPR